MTNNLFFLLTGDPGRETLDPDFLGEMVKIEWGSNLLNQIFNIIARYVRKVHSDEHIRKVLMRYNAERSFLDIIGVGRRGTNQLRLLERYLDILVKHTTEILPPTALVEVCPRLP